jgi:glycerol uptake facilitator-like aquaporin
MSVLTFVLVLLVIAVVIYAIKLVIAQNWKQLAYLAIGLVVAIIILGMLGIKLPDIPTIQ